MCYRWRFTFYLYIFTYGVRFLKKVSVAGYKVCMSHCGLILCMARIEILWLPNRLVPSHETGK